MWLWMVKRLKSSIKKSNISENDVKNIFNFYKNIISHKFSHKEIPTG